jgi:hypothetical protein
MKTLSQRLRPYRFLTGLIALLSIATILSFVYFEIDLSTFLAILLPALVGVFGSYGLALKRKVDETRRLRKALYTELQEMKWFYNWPSIDSTTPSVNPISTEIYKQNADSLGLLTDQEITSIVEFYSSAQIVGDQLEYHQENRVRAKSHILGQDFDKKSRMSSIAEQIDLLALSHQRALITISSELGDPEVDNISEDSILSAESPLIRRNETLCREYGLITRVDEERYRITKEGADFFGGEKELGALVKNNQLVKRNKSGVYRLFRFIYEKLVS